MHVVDSRLLGRGQKIASIVKEGALQFAKNRKSVLDIKDGEKLAADRVAFSIMRSEIALAITADGSGAAVEETFVDRDRGQFVRAGVVQRMNEPGTRAKCEKRLLKPALQRRLRLIFNDPRGERLGPEGKKISQARGAPGQLDFAAERLRRETEGRINNQTARRNERALAQIKCRRKTDRTYEIGGLVQQVVLD